MNPTKHISTSIGISLIILISTAICWTILGSIEGIRSLQSINVQIPTPSHSGSNRVGECIDAAGVDISSDMDRITSEISKKGTCSSASDLAESCAWGSTADIGITSSASRVCRAEFEKNKPSEKLTSTLNDLVSECHKKYKDMQGTMYVSLEHYCALDALRLVTDISGSGDIEFSQ